MDPNKRNQTKFGTALLTLFGLFIIGVGILWVSSYLVNKTGSGGQTVKTVIATPPPCPTDYASYEALVEAGQSIDLVKDLNTYASGGQFVNSKTVTVSRSGTDQIACGYLYVRAHIDGHPLEQKYDSVYINPQGLGGHILASRTIAISSSTPDTTEVLLPLDAIPYLPSLPYDPNAQNYQIANWVDLLNAANRINFIVGLSTIDPRGVIDDIKIAYICWNPSTNQETTNCQLSIQQ